MEDDLLLASIFTFIMFMYYNDERRPFDIFPTFEACIAGKIVSYIMSTFVKSCTDSHKCKLQMNENYDFVFFF